MNLGDYAKATVGNWKRFRSFYWSGQHDIDSPEHWAIFYTCKRDSDLLEESNHDYIATVLAPYSDDVEYQHHKHWAFGWIGGFAIRVYRDGFITPAFRAWYELQERIEQGEMLDPEDYYERKYEEGIAEIKNNERHLNAFVLPDDWAEQVYDHLDGDNYSYDVVVAACADLFQEKDDE